MNRFNYPFTRIILKPSVIQNNHQLDLNEISTILSKDKDLHKRKTLQHFYPDSEGKPVFSYGEEIWFVLKEPKADQIKIISVQRDTTLYCLFTYIAFVILLCMFFSGLRRFAFGFGVFSLMGYGIILIGNKVGDSRVESKLKEIAQAINQG